MKKIIFCILLMIIGKFTFAVVNTHTPGTPAWHNYNNMMMGQLEYERQQRERAAQQAQPQPQQPPMEKYISRSVFVWNDETGKAFYLPCEGERDRWGAKKAIVNRAKKYFSQIHGEEANRYIDWECNYAVITMGISKKSGKIEAFVDTDIKSWVKKYGGDDPDSKAKIERDALDYCATQADNCEIIYELGDFGEKK